MIRPKYIPLFLSLTLFCNNAYSSPTKSETFNFIKDKVSGYKWSNNDTKFNTYLRSSKNFCTLYVEKLRKEDNYPLNREFWVVNLKDIDPYVTDISLDGYTPDLRVHTREEKEAVKIFHDTLDKKKHDDTASFLLLMTNSERNVRKVEKAMVHLVKLCGGKGELF